MSPRVVAQSAGRALVQSPSAVIVGAITGVMLVLWWPQINESAARFYDSLHPVATGEYVVVSRTDEAVTFELRVTRNRECGYGPPPHAFVELPGGDLAAARVERVDGTPPGISYPAGSTYNAGTWRISPVAGAVRARMVARYECGGRLTHSVIADIPL
jgi:hypothetical protein